MRCRLITRSSPINDRYFHEWFSQPNVSNPVLVSVDVLDLVFGVQVDSSEQPITSLSRVWKAFPNTETIRSHKSRARIPSNLNPTSKEMISDSVEQCETEVCFLRIRHYENVWIPKMHNVPREVDFEPQNLPHNRRLETVPVCIVWKYYPQSDTVCIHMCDECMKSIDSGVCVTSFGPFRNRPCKFIYWSKNNEVFQFVPTFNISEQFGSILVTILQQISFLLLWGGGHRCRE